MLSDEDVSVVLAQLSDGGVRKLPSPPKFRACFSADLGERLCAVAIDEEAFVFHQAKAQSQNDHQPIRRLLVNGEVRTGHFTVRSKKGSAPDEVAVSDDGSTLRVTSPTKSGQLFTREPHATEVSLGAF